MGPNKEALFAAIKYGSMRDVMYWIDMGTNPNDMDEKNQYNALFYAVAYQQLEIVYHLLQYKVVNVNATNCAGNTAMMVAVKKRNFDLCLMLINAGAHHRAAAPDGSTALTASLFFGDIPMIKLLMSQTDPKSLSDKEILYADVALAKAMRENNKELIHILKNLGTMRRNAVSINVKDDFPSASTSLRLDVYPLEKTCPLHSEVVLVPEKLQPLFTFSPKFT